VICCKTPLRFFFLVPASLLQFLQGPAGHAKVSAEVSEDSWVLRVRRLCTPSLIASELGSSPPERPGLDQYEMLTMVWRNLLPYHRFWYFVLSFLVKRAWPVVVSHYIRQDRGNLRQTTVETSYCSRPVRSGGDEPGLEAIGGRVHKRRILNTRLSVGTFAVSASLYINSLRTTSNKGLENWSSRFEPKITLNSFSMGPGPPLRLCFQRCFCFLVC